MTLAPGESAEGRRFSARDRAEVAFAEARTAGALPRIREEMFALSNLLRGQARLRKALADSGVPPEAKGEVVGALFARRLDPRTLSLVEDLVVEASVAYRLPQVLEDLGVQATLAEADAAGQLTGVADALFRFARVVDAQPELRSALTNPALPDGTKQSLVGDLLDGRVPAEAVELARWAVVRPGDPVERLEALADRAAARQQRVVVEVRSAVPLDGGRVRRLGDALSAATGLKVDVEAIVDPSVVGGVVARVGDEVIDGTVRRKLDLARELLTA
jgi:F-type H+-transporting ATPase subunit delta